MISWCITFVICFIRVSCLPTPSLDLLHKIHLLSLSIRGAGVSVHSFHGHVNHYSRAIGLVKALRIYVLWIVSVPMKDAGFGSRGSFINILPLQDSIKTKPFCSNSLVKDSSPKSPFSANFAPSCNIKSQAWKETYKYKHCDCETFDETHAQRCKK